MLTPFLALLAPCLHQAPIEPGHFVGTLRAGTRVGRIELELAGAEARVDLPDSWSLGLRAVVEREGELLTIRVPEFGTLHLGASADGLVGGLEYGADEAEVELQRRPAAEVRLEALRFPSGSLELAGTLGLPRGPGPHAAVILVPGGGDSARTQASTRFLCEYLPRFGLACLVYDKRGAGESDGDWRAAGIAELATDALAAVRALRARSDVRAECIGFFAASQGTWVALEACAREPDAVAFLVNHSGPAVSLLEADTFALRSSARAAGLDPAQEEEVVALWRLECDALRLGLAPAAHAPLLTALEKARTRPWFARLPYAATAADSWWVGWYPRVMDHDPRAALAALALPTLWLYGSADTQSDVVANLARVGELTRRGARPWSTHLFPGGDHGISLPLFEGSAAGPRVMGEGYFELLLAWLARRAQD